MQFNNRLCSSTFLIWHVDVLIEIDNLLREVLYFQRRLRSTHHHRLSSACETMCFYALKHIPAIPNWTIEWEQSWLMKATALFLAGVYCKYFCSKYAVEWDPENKNVRKHNKENKGGKHVEAEGMSGQFTQWCWREKWMKALPMIYSKLLRRVMPLTVKEAKVCSLIALSP